MTDQHGNCPICQSPLSQPPTNTGGGTIEHRCQLCGDFLLTGDTRAALPHLLGQDPLNRLRLRHTLVWRSPSQGPLRLDTAAVDRLLKEPLPNVPEQMDNLIVWFGERIRQGKGKLIDEDNDDQYRAIAGVETSEGLGLVIKALGKREWFDIAITDLNKPYVKLSVDGWLRFYDLTRSSRGSKRAFMAMQYGNPELDRIVAEVFQPAVALTGFKLAPLNQEPKAGLIDDHLRVEIRRSRFLIADLTHENRGAYWEAGFAEGLGKPVIYTCEKGRFEKEKSHFDTNHHVTVLWDSSHPKETADDLKATIRATLPDEARMEDPPVVPG